MCTSYTTLAGQYFVSIRLPFTDSSIFCLNSSPGLPFHRFAFIAILHCIAICKLQIVMGESQRARLQSWRADVTREITRAKTTTPLGGMNIVISACETETCATDKCNGDSGADSITSSAILIFLTLTTFLLRL